MEVQIAKVRCATIFDRIAKPPSEAFGSWGKEMEKANSKVPSIFRSNAAEEVSS